MATTMVHIRVDEKIKRQAAKTLAAMGISVSDAVRMLLVRVVAERALPFEVRIPNATTVKAMKAAERGQGKRYKSADSLIRHLTRTHAAKSWFGARYLAADIPPTDAAGVYAFFLDDPKMLNEIRVDESGLLYIGRTESSLDVRNHFNHANSGFSTLRRTLGAILKKRRHFKVLPRGTGKSRTNVQNYRFSDRCEAELTAWMVSNLRYSFVVVEGDIKAAERKRIKELRPPLNLQGWENPQRNHLKQLRSICLEEAYSIQQLT